MKIAFAETSEPNCTTALKIRTLTEQGKSEVHAVYWKRLGSLISTPLSVALPEERIWPVAVPAGGRPWQKMWNRFKALSGMLGVLRKIRPDVIHVSTVDTLVVCGLIGRVAKNIVFDLQDTAEWMRKPWALFLLKRALARVKIVFVTSPRFLTDFLQKHSVVSRQTEVVCIPNAPPQVLFLDFRTRVAPGKLVVGYIGTFRGRGALLTLETGIQVARQRGAPVTALFAGTGPELALVNQICGRNEGFRNLGPFRYQDDIRRLYEQVNVIYAVYDASADKKIHFACRLPEAVACGYPSIVMEGTYMAEVVRQHQIGFVVPLEDAEALARALLEMVNNPEHMEEIRTNGQRVAPCFYFEHHADKYLSAFRRMEKEPKNSSQ